MRLTKVLLIGAIALGVAGISFEAEAYQLSGSKWSGGVGLTYTWGSNLQTSGTVARTAFETAVADWNATPTRVYFSYNSGSLNDFNTYSVYNSTNYGYTNVTTSGSSIVYFSSLINASNINITQSNVARSTAVHEIGHGLGLAEGNVAISVMNMDRNRSSIYTPQTDDINGINAMYP